MAYKKLEYIQSAVGQNQYIDTGVACTSNIDYEIQYAVIGGGAIEFQCIIGSDGYYNSFYPYCKYGSVVSGEYIAYCYNSVEWAHLGIDLQNVKSTLKKERNVFKLSAENGFSKTLTHASTSSFTRTSTMFILAMSKSVPDYCVAKVYSCKIYDNGTLVRDYVPARDTDTGDVGLYDLLSGTLYVSKNGKFLAGPDINVKKCLVRDGNALYTVTDGTLAVVEGELTSELFKSSGIDTVPDGALLTTLSAPEVLCWTDSDTLPTLTATVTGVPQPQVIVSEEINLMDGSIKGISGVTVDCKGDVLFAVSFDKKATWLMHNGTEWVAVSDEVTGMTKTVFEAVTTEQWQTQYETASDMYIRCTLLDETQSLTSITLNFIN